MLEKILDMLPDYISKKEMQKVKLNTLDIVVKEEHFELPTGMSKTECAEFFAHQVRKDQLYWQKLSFILCSIMSQLKSAKKDLRKLLQVEGDDSQLVPLSLRELHSMLAKDAGVVLTES